MNIECIEGEVCDENFSKIFQGTYLFLFFDVHVDVLFVGGLFEDDLVALGD